MATTHTWKFFRAGGFNQVVIGCGADLANLDQLDQKLWVALACPTTGVEFDKTTLALIISEKTNSHFERITAASNNVADIRRIIDQAHKRETPNVPA